METKRIRRFASVLAIGGGTCLTMVGAHADTTDDLLDKLLQKGILSQQEVDQLKQRKQEAPAVQPLPATAAVVSADSSNYLALVSALRPGDTLNLAPGSGMPAAWIREPFGRSNALRFRVRSRPKSSGVRK